MLLLLLLLLLTLLLSTTFILNNREIFAPSFIFTGSFILCCVWAFAYRNAWSLDLHMNTFWVILGGVIVFIVASEVTKLPFQFFYRPGNREVSYFSSVRNWKMLIIIIIELITIIYTIYDVKQIVPANSLAQSIYGYRSQVISSSASATLTSLPKILSAFRLFTNAAGYFFLYLLAKNLVVNKKVNFLYVVASLLSIISGLLLGARSALLIQIICFVSDWLLIDQKMRLKKGIHIRKILLLIILVVVITFSFQSLASILGRNTTQYSMTQYLSIYVGAEIKNLDVFLQSSIFPVRDGLFGSQTLYSLYQGLGPMLNNQQIVLDLPFQSVNGLGLGNVYTTFYPYVYDFGYIGVPIFSGIMGIMSQISFELAKKSALNGQVQISILIYSRIIAALIFSFFSSKFYEEIVTVGFVEMIIVWILLMCFCRNGRDQYRKGFD